MCVTDLLCAIVRCQRGYACSPKDGKCYRSGFNTKPPMTTEEPTTEASKCGALANQISTNQAKLADYTKRAEESSAACARWVW